MKARPVRAIKSSLVSSRALPGSLALVVLAMANPAAFATQLYWDSDATANSGSATTTASGTWGTSAFWNTSSTGAAVTRVAANTVNDDLYFSAFTDVTGASAITVSTTRSANSITFEEGTVTISGGTSVTLGGGTGVNPAGLIFASGTGANVISTPIILGAANTFTNNDDGLQTIGNISGGFGLTLNGTGTGSILLSGTNTYSGATLINAGAVRFGKTASLYNGVTSNWTAANLSVASGATVSFNVGGTGEFSTGDVTTLLANLGGLGGAVASNGLKAGSAIGFDTTNASGGTFTISDNIANSTGTGGGAIGLTKLGTNTLVLSGSNSYTGNTTLTAGSLSAGASDNLGGSASNLVFDGGTLQITGTALTNFSGIGHSVVFNSGKTVGFDINSASNTFTADQVLNQTSGGLTKLGAGTLILSQANTYTGATNVLSGTLQVVTGGSLAASAGSTATTGLNVGGTSNALLAINGGTIGSIGGNSYIGLATTDAAFPLNTATNTGTLYMTSGSISPAANFHVGFAYKAGSVTGTGSVFQTGGTFTQANTAGTQFSIGVTSGTGAGNAIGTYSISGGTATTTASANNVTIGFGALSNGTLNVDGGSFTFASTNIILANNATGSATFNLGGGTLTTPAWATVVSTLGTVKVNFHGGTLQASSTGSSNFFSAGTSAVNLYAGGGTIDTQANSFTITQVFQNPSGSGISTPAIATADSTTVFSSPPTVTFSGGSGSGGSAYATLDSNGHINGIIVTNVGSYTSAPTLSVAGSTVAFATPTLTANSTGGLTKIGSGTLTLTGASTYTGETKINAGTITMSGASSSLGSGAALTLGGGQLNLNTLSKTVGAVSITTAFASGDTIRNGSLTGTSYAASNTAGNAVISANLLANGSAGFTKSGAGTVTLAGANTYSGSTLISGGTLALSSTGTIDNTSEVSLGSNGTFDVSAKSDYSVSKLSGSGTVVGSLTVSTTLAIGNSPGTVNFGSNLTLDSAAYVYEMTGGATPGIGSADLANVTGTITIVSGSTLDLVELGNYTVGNKFTLFSYTTGISGTFDGLANNSIFLDDLSNSWQIRYDDISAGLNGGSGSSFVTITAVPEPATALVGSLGVLIMLRRRRTQGADR